MSMNELLASYEDDLGIESNKPDFGNEEGATIASEVNMLK